MGLTDRQIEDRRLRGIDMTLYNVKVLERDTDDLESMLDHSMDTSDIVKVPLITTVTYDYAVDGGTTGTTDLNSGTEMLPDNSIITNVVCDTITSPNSSGGTGTIKFILPTDGDLTNVWVADGTLSGLGLGIPGGLSHNMIKTTAARKIQVVISNENLTAGKIKIFIYYVKSD